MILVDRNKSPSNDGRKNKVLISFNDVLKSYEVEELKILLLTGGSILLKITVDALINSLFLTKDNNYSVI